MNTGTYFTLQSAYSLNVKGVSGRKYQFSKNIPCNVTSQPDVDYFRSRSDLIETDNNGNSLKKSLNGKAPLSYTALKKTGLLGQNVANETIIEEAFQKTQNDEELAKVRLEQATRDVANKSDEKIKKIVPVSKKNKDGILECTKCGAKFEPGEEVKFNDHMMLHEEEDE